jgi:formate dehydrogenase subunit delta
MHMANRIGEFFATMPDATEAHDSIAMHLRRYWDPRMCRQLLDHVAEHDGAGLSPIVLQAERQAELA